MRGDLFHNKLVKDAEAVFGELDWQTDTERMVCTKGVTTYFDLFAWTDSLIMACEIETTCRHALGNFRKAQATEIPLWIIVPTRRIRQQIQRSLGTEQIFPGGKPVEIIFPDELKECIQTYMKTNTLKGTDHENQME